MATEIRMPQFGVSMETGTVAQWLKAEGDTVKAGDVLASIETEKLTNDVVSEVDGVLLKIVAQEGEDVPVQGLMAYVGQPGEALPDAGGTAAPTAAESAPVTVESVPAAGQVSGGRVKASPLARKIAAKLGVDLSQVTPGGTSGRIRADDVRAYAAQVPTAARYAALDLPENGRISDNYLGAMVLELIGYSGESAFFDELNALRRELPVYREREASYCLADGVYTDVISEALQDELVRLHKWTYYLLK